MYFLADPALCSDTNLQGVLGIVKFVFNVICIIVPIILILLGAIDLFKAVTSQKDDAIKKQTNLLIKRVIAGLIIFLLPTIVKLLMSWLGNSGDNSFANCWDKSSFSTGVFNTTN